MYNQKTDSELWIKSLKTIYSHTGALFAVPVSRAHVWAAVSNVEIIQSPGLLLVKWSLL